MMKASHVDGVPVMKGRKLLGIVTALDIARIPEASWPETPAQSVMTTELVVGRPYQTVYQAWEIMSQKNISHLPIVEEGDGRYLIGIMDMRDIAACYRWASPVPASAV
jgi:CBS domain-containing protein